MCPPGFAATDPVGHQQLAPGYAGMALHNPQPGLGQGLPLAHGQGVARHVSVSTPPGAVAQVSVDSVPSSAGASPNTRAGRPAPGSSVGLSDAHSLESASSDDDSGSEGEGKEHGEDPGEVIASGVTSATPGTEPLSPAVSVGQFPSDTSEIVQRLAIGLGLEYGSPKAPEAPSLLSMGGLGARQRRQEPALTLPPNLTETWRRYDEKKDGKPVVDLSFHSYADVLRVCDEDYVSLLKVPSLDEDVAKFLPSVGKTGPTTYSPYWEEQLRILDTRARVSVKLASFSYLVSNHLGNQIQESSGKDSALWRECNLAATLATTSLHEAMLLARKTVLLRRGNVCASLESTFNKDLSEDLKKADIAQGKLFGDSFCDTVEKLAKKVTQQRTLQEQKNTLTKGKFGKKQAAKKGPSSAGPSSAGGASSSAGNSSTPKPAAAASAPGKGKKRVSKGTGGKPPQGKRFKGGKQSRT